MQVAEDLLSSDAVDAVVVCAGGGVRLMEAVRIDISRALRAGVKTVNSEHMCPIGVQTFARIARWAGECGKE